MAASVATPSWPKPVSSLPSRGGPDENRVDHAFAVAAVAGEDELAVRLDHHAAGVVGGLLHVDDGDTPGPERAVEGAGAGQPHDGVVGVVAVLRRRGAEDDDPTAAQRRHAPGVVGDVALADGLARTDVDDGRAALAEGRVGLAGSIEAEDRDVGVLGRRAGRLGILLHRAGDQDLPVRLHGDRPGHLDGLAADRHVDDGQASLAEGRVQFPVRRDLGQGHGVVAAGIGPPGGVQAAVGPVRHGEQPVGASDDRGRAATPPVPNPESSPVGVSVPVVSPPACVAGSVSLSSEQAPRARAPTARALNSLVRMTHSPIIR